LKLGLPKYETGVLPTESLGVIFLNVLKKGHQSFNILDSFIKNLCFYNWSSLYLEAEKSNVAKNDQIVIKITSNIVFKYASLIPYSPVLEKLTVVQLKGKVKLSL
jgi:hypothetical protein